MKMSEFTENGERPSSSYLRYLPAIYQEDAFVGQFLRIFEDILSPVAASVNALPDQFAPRLASPAMLDILATWVHAAPLPRAGEPQWRAFIAESVWLHRWRGSKRCLRRAIELAVGRRPLITEYGGGLVLGADAVLGRNTSADEGHPLHFTITMPCEERSIDRVLLTHIIGAYKPAGTAYRIVFEGDPGEA
jgi:phage tail-like protein